MSPAVSLTSSPVNVSFSISFSAIFLNVDVIGSAGFKSSIRFVAAITTTPLLSSDPL